MKVKYSDNDTVCIESAVQTTSLPVVPLSQRSLTPGVAATGTISSLNSSVSKSFSSAVLKKKGTPTKVIFLLNKSELAYPPEEHAELEKHFSTVGVVGEMSVISDTPQAFQIKMMGLHRCEIISVSFDTKDSCLLAEYKNFQEELHEEDALSLQAYQEQFLLLLEGLLHALDTHSTDKDFYDKIVQCRDMLQTITHNRLALFIDILIWLIHIDKDDIENVLVEKNLWTRCDLLLPIINQKILIIEKKREIQKKVSSKINKTQNVHMLKEHMKMLQEEIDAMDSSDSASNFNNILNNPHIPEYAMKTIIENINKLKRLESYSPEYNIIYNYIQWLSSLPWGKHSDFINNISEVKETLNDTHYGMDDLKEFIAEISSIYSLTGKTPTSCLCLVGVPGIGKTTIAKTIAKSLNKPFFSIPVGGLTDVAELKGHRRTYVGAIPGKIIHAMKKTEVMDPVILIDEIDKIGHSYYGDPAYSLLEVLDKSQNNMFMDHYIEMPFDISKVFFIATANVLEDIPYCLRDRLHIINLRGYTHEEKEEIVKKHLIPIIREESGLTEEKCSIDPAIIQPIIRDYSRESGVRGLDKTLRHILYKVVHHIVINDLHSFSLSKENYTDFVKLHINSSERIFGPLLPVGVAQGLAYTSAGGTLCYTEASKIQLPDPEKESSISCTGSIGNIMKESSTVAWYYVLRLLSEIDPSLCKGHNILLHFPDGATSKEGPSAGVAIVSALLSLALNQRIPSHIGFTGEVTATGKILPIGGLPEKLISAVRNDITDVFLPIANANDVALVPESTRNALKIHYVTHYEHLLPHLFTVPSLAQ